MDFDILCNNEDNNTQERNYKDLMKAMEFQFQYDRMNMIDEVKQIHAEKK